MAGRGPARSVPSNRLAVPLGDTLAAAPVAWRPIVEAFAAGPVGRSLIGFVDARLQSGVAIYPATPLRALELVAPAGVKVVILGQDPYHGPGQAQGLAFSVAPGQPPPPSLRNLLKEVHTDLGAPSQCRDDLTPWAAQGVLLLNSALTVEDGAPQSHAGRGWESLTDALLARVADEVRPVVFMLWGASARRKRAIVERAHHRILVSNHPSPLSASRPPEPFLGSRPFSRANDFLAGRRPGSEPIRW